jgi:hypothetical protein
MSASSKIMGLLAGVSAVAVIGVAVAQGVEPNADIANMAQGAGQQSSQETSMGETGVPVWEKQINTAVVAAPQPVAIIEPAPAPVAIIEPAPAAQPAATMGASPAPAAEAPMQMAQAPVARADRN